VNTDALAALLTRNQHGTVDAATKATSAIFTYTAGASKYLIVKAYRASIGNVYDPYSRDSENAKAIAKHISVVEATISRVGVLWQPFFWCFLPLSDLNSHRGEAIYAVNTLYRQDPSSNFEEKDIYKVSPRQPLGFPLLILLFY
jgi:hypothetical protein